MGLEPTTFPLGGERATIAPTSLHMLVFAILSATDQVANQATIGHLTYNFFVSMRQNLRLRILLTIFFYSNYEISKVAKPFLWLIVVTKGTI